MHHNIGKPVSEEKPIMYANLKTLCTQEGTSYLQAL
jgi:hypothetical protein